jgi:hypothetical protein
VARATSPRLMLAVIAGQTHNSDFATALVTAPSYEQLAALVAAQERTIAHLQRLDSGNHLNSHPSPDVNFRAIFSIVSIPPKASGSRRRQE